MADRTSGLMRTTENLTDRLNKHATNEGIEELTYKPALDELKRAARRVGEEYEVGGRKKDKRTAELIAAALKFYDAEKLLGG